MDGFKTPAPTARRHLRAAGIVALVLLLAVGTAACGKKKSDAQLAAEALQAGLKAHAEGHLSEAQTDYQKVLIYDPQNKFAYYNLGVIDQTQGKAADAEAKYRQALAIDPNFVDALYNLAILRTSAGDLSEAQQLYERVIKVNPNYAAAHLNLGFLLIDEGKKKRGQQELQTAVSLDPSLSSRVPQEYLPPSGIEPTPSPTT